MFSKLTVENFKSFSKLTVDNLSRINLFFGRNNCGKTSLLESLFILSGIANPELPLKCNQFRGFTGIRDISLFFHNLNIATDIVIHSESDTPFFARTLSLHPQMKIVKTVNEKNIQDIFYADTALSEISELVFNGEVKNKNNKMESVKTVARIREGKSNERIQFSISSKYKEIIDCNYFTPSISLATIIPSIKKIFSNKQEETVITALQNIDTRIRDFILADDVIMVDIGLDKRLPINLLGDGVRKFFTLVVAMSNSQDGILLVDEIDNGLHFSTMEKFWSILVATSRMFNVQLFATTHNIDSLKGLNSVLLQKENTDYQHDVSAYKLLHHTDDTNSALYYDFKSFSDLIFAETEIR